MQNEYYPITGIEAAYVAFGVLDTTSAYSAGTPALLPPTQNVNWVPTQASEAFYGSNTKQGDVYGTETSSIKVQFVGISDELDARLRGKAMIAASGRVVGSGNTTPPIVALGLKINKAPGQYNYIWFLKGTFSGGAVVAQTKEEKVTISTREYTFAAAETTKQFTFTDAITSTSITTGLTWFKGETATAAFDGSTWFSQVQTPDVSSAPSAIALSSIVPADAATGITTTASVVLTFNNKISEQAVTVIKSTDGSVVATTASFDAAGKVLTLAHATAFTSAAKYFVILADVIDVYGQTLAPVTKSFTCA